MADARSNSATFSVATAWGDTLLEVDGPFLTGLRPPAAGSTAASTMPIDRAPAELRELAEAIVAYFDGEPVQLATAEQLDRWLAAAGVSGARRTMSLALHEVPRGVTISYGELAELAGYPGAARAAGSACARNPLPILVPCHRVVHAGARAGDVGSYGAATGSDYKRRLLELEDAALVRVAASGS